MAWVDTHLGGEEHPAAVSSRRRWKRRASFPPPGIVVVAIVEILFIQTQLTQGWLRTRSSLISLRVPRFRFRFR